MPFHRPASGRPGGANEPPVRYCPWLSPREVHGEIFKPIFGPPVDARKAAYLQVAEAEGNRTPLTEVLGHNGFEDRAAHQDGYASSGSPAMIPTPFTAPESVHELQIYLVRGARGDLDAPRRTKRSVPAPPIRDESSIAAATASKAFWVARRTWMTFLRG